MKKRGLFAGKHIQKTEQIALALFLVVVGVAGRFFLVNYPNIETVMVATFLIALFVDKRAAFLFPLVIMAVSDHLMGYQLFALSGMASIWLFTYTGFAFIYFLGRRQSKRIKKDLGRVTGRSAINAAGYGVVFALVYDVWTNLGAWLLMYPHTLDGLVLCYVMATPFMLYHMISGAVTFVTLGLPFVALHDLRNSARDELPVDSSA